MEKYMGYPIPGIPSNNCNHITAESLKKEECFYNMINEKLPCSIELRCKDCLFANIDSDVGNRAALVEWLTDRGTISKGVRLEFELLR